MKKGKLNYFEILGVSESASKSDIKMAFLKLSKRYNPDRFGSAATPDLKDIARYVYTEIKKAYHILKEKSKARKVDKEKKDGTEFIELDEIDFSANLQENIEIEFENEVVADEQEAEEPDELEIQMHIQEEMTMVRPEQGPDFKEQAGPSEEPKNELIKERAKVSRLTTKEVKFEIDKKKEITDQFADQEKTPLERAEALYEDKKYDWVIFVFLFETREKIK